MKESLGRWCQHRSITSEENQVMVEMELIYDDSDDDNGGDGVSDEKIMMMMVMVVTMMGLL